MAFSLVNGIPHNVQVKSNFCFLSLSAAESIDTSVGTFSFEGTCINKRLQENTQLFII
jgi:hypothetical protein